jgi:DNA topoisomerase-1
VRCSHASAARRTEVFLTHGCAGKKPEDDLFDLIDPTKVNKHLQQLMPGLTIKVFRTYNASITLSRLLTETDSSKDVAGKKAQVRCGAWPHTRGCRILLTRGCRACPQYDEANKEVAILCNHQKGVSKNHDTAMAKLEEKKKALEEELQEAKGPAAARIR